MAWWWAFKQAPAATGVGSPRAPHCLRPGHPLPGPQPLACNVGEESFLGLWEAGACKLQGLPGECPPHTARPDSHQAPEPHLHANGSPDPCSVPPAPPQPSGLLCPEASAHLLGSDDTRCVFWGVLICGNRGLTTSLGAAGSQSSQRSGVSKVRTGRALGPAGAVQGGHWAPRLPGGSRLSSACFLLSSTACTLPRTAAQPQLVPFPGRILHPLKETVRGWGGGISGSPPACPQAHCSTSCLGPWGLRPPPQAWGGPPGVLGRLWVRVYKTGL